MAAQLTSRPPAPALAHPNFDHHGSAPQLQQQQQQQQQQRAEMAKDEAETGSMDPEPQPQEETSPPEVAVQQAQASLPTNVDASAMGLAPAGQPPEKSEHRLAWPEGSL